ncbi:MAG: hypothetical protein JSV56_02710 [Methanomassiliicoccales archaeon]|nr:MAG: hypothetical protein JSV56_02710 [Methanomassiliicoccales archaeon]
MVEVHEKQEAEKEKEEKINSEKGTAIVLRDPKINVRILLAAFWVSHFLLWTFGDMVALLQHKNPDPISNDLLLFAAAPLAVIQTLMIVFSLIGKPKFVRLANIIVPIVFLLFNLGYISEAVDGWEYLLGIVYVLFNVLIIWTAWKWPVKEASAAVESS